MGIATPGKGPAGELLATPAGTFGATGIDVEGKGATGVGAMVVGVTDTDTGKPALVEPKAGTCGGGVAEG